MNTNDRIKKAKIQLMTSNGFFAYLCMHLKIEEDNQGVTNKEKGVAITPDGTLYYNDEYISQLSRGEIVGMLCHEILHLSLLHLQRREERDKERWDMSTDIKVNSLLNKNNFVIPFTKLIPDENDEWRRGKIHITDCDKKSVEDIYHLIVEEGKKKKQNNSNKGNNSNTNGDDDTSDKSNKNGKSNKKDDQLPQGFDNHLSDNMTNQELKQSENDWKDKVQQAYISSKTKGDLPLGLEALIGDLYKSKIKWRNLLKKFIQKMLPVDYTWVSPSKKSRSVGIYMPNVVKDKIDICVGIDTSGSVSNEELTEFMSEVVQIFKDYNNSVTMRIISHDIDVHTDTKVTNLNKNNVKNVKLKGRGGTSHKPIIEHINKTGKCDVAVFFTDGFSDIEEIEFKKNRFESLFVISKNGTIPNIEKKRKVHFIKVEDEGK